MTKESILTFSQSKAEPAWLQEKRLAAFDKIDDLELPRIERVKFQRWNLGDGTITESPISANVPDFTSFGENPKLVQLGTQTVLESLPANLGEQGVVFTDFHSALEKIPQVIEKHFATALKFDEDKLSAYHTAYFNSGAVLYVPDNVEIDLPFEEKL